MKSIKKSKVYYSSTEKILGHFKIATPEETVKKLIKENKSIARYGDGEFDMIYGKGMNYQKYDKELAKRLYEVLNSNEKDLLIGIPNVCNFEYIDKYIDFAANFWYKWLNDYKFKLLKLLHKNKEYYSSAITRFYIDYKDKSNIAEYVKLLRKIWENKDVVIIEGEHSRLGVGNDLFDNMKSIQRIICPSENAFDKYDAILHEAMKIDKDKLILLALGPTATVLAYDLYKLGYRALDIGHVDIEYEWFLRKATEKIRIETKYVTEVKNGRSNILNVNDKKYESQIIAKIL